MIADIIIIIVVAAIFIACVRYVRSQMKNGKCFGCPASGTGSCTHCNTTTERKSRMKEFRAEKAAREQLKKDA